MPVKFSEQNLVDCSWNFGNDGCNGGEDLRAYGWMMHNGGLMLDEDYGHYLGIDGWCHFNKTAAAVKITDYVLTTPGSVEELEDEISVNVDYSIDANCEYLADCNIKMKIQATGK